MDAGGIGQHLFTMALQGLIFSVVVIFSDTTLAHRLWLWAKSGILTLNYPSTEWYLKSCAELHPDDNLNVVFCGRHAAPSVLLLSWCGQFRRAATGDFTPGEAG